MYIERPCSTNLFSFVVGALLKVRDRLRLSRVRALKQFDINSPVIGTASQSSASRRMVQPAFRAVHRLGLSTAAPGSAQWIKQPRTIPRPGVAVLLTVLLAARSEQDAHPRFITTPMQPFFRVLPAAGLFANPNATVIPPRDTKLLQ